jgi:hypothetical protein
MRCSRVSEYDNAGQNLREVQLLATDHDGAPLESASVVYGNLAVNFLDPGGAEIEHDALVDVTITVTAPAGQQKK